MLYFAMAKFVLPKVSSVVEKRETTVKGDIDAATTQSTAAEAERKAADDAVAKARASARAAVEAQRAKATAELTAEQTKAEEAIAQRIAAAEQRIADTRGKALAEVDGLARDLAKSIVEKVLPQGVAAAEPPRRRVGQGETA